MGGLIGWGGVSIGVEGRVVQVLVEEWMNERGWAERSFITKSRRGYRRQEESMVVG